MSRQDLKDQQQLQTLEKWRSSELERAQTEHVTQQRIVKEKESAVEKVQGVINESQSLARSQLEGSQVLSAESLTRIRHFTSLQLQELQQATSSLQESQRQEADARKVVVRKFEQLSVVERLRERRTTQTQRTTLRKEQNRLDDQALMRSARPQGRQPKMEQEE